MYSEGTSISRLMHRLKAATAKNARRNEKMAVNSSDRGGEEGARVMNVVWVSLNRRGVRRTSGRRIAGPCASLPPAVFRCSLP